MANVVAQPQQDVPVQTVAGLVGDISANELQAALNLANVTNDVQTKAEIVPNTVPAAGRILIGNVSGTAYAPQPVGGDATLTAAGLLTVTKTNGTDFGTMATQDANDIAITGGTITGMPSPTGSTDVATKGYVDGFISSPMSFKGTINCATEPNYPAGDTGDVYIVNASGKIGGSSGIVVEIGDMVVALADNAGGTHASVGASWATIEHNLQGALLVANNLSDVANVVTTRQNLGLEIGVNVLAPTGDGSGLANIVTSIAGLHGSISSSTLKSTISLNNLTNDVQTKAAIVPNTPPSAGQVLVGNAGGTAYAPVAISGDGTLSSAGVLTVTKTNGTNLGSMATQSAGAVNITGGTIVGLPAPTVSTAAATKGYVDGLISNPMSFKSAINCSTSPNYPAASLGDVYVVNAAGKIGGASGTPVDVGDMLIAIVANGGGTQASVGNSWVVIEHNLQGAMLAANNLSDVANVVTARLNLGLVIGSDVLAPTGSGGALTGVVYSIGGTTGAITNSTLRSQLAINNVTNDVQAKAAIYPNSLPAAGQLAVGNAGGTAYAPVTVSGDATLTSTGVLTVTKTNGTNLGSMAVQNANAISVTGGTLTNTTHNSSTISSATISGSNISGGTITNLPTPSASTDAATKGYVDGLVTNPMSFQTSIDCSANPNYPTAVKGYIYVVSVAGKIGGASGTPVDAGDLLLAIGNAASGTQAAVGSNWTILEHNLQGALLAANNLSDLTNAATARSNLGLVIGTNVLAPTGDGSGLINIVRAVAGLTGAITGATLKSTLSLNNVTNDVQAKASIYPNTVPAAGRILVGNAGSTAYAPVVMSGDGFIASNGAITITKTNGTDLGTMAVQAANAVAITGGTITGMSVPTDSSDVATKGYVDSFLTNPMTFQGTLDCSTNPNFPAADAGDVYIVTVAGIIGGGSGTDVDAGDMLICKDDSTAAGDLATVGSHWSIIEHNLEGVLYAANNLSDLTSTATARSNLGLVIGTNVLAPTGDGSGLTGIVTSFVSLTGVVDAINARTALSISNVTNDAQTKAAIVPNTTPSAGSLLVGNSGGTAYANVAVSGDATLASTGALTVTKTNGTNFGTMATQSANAVAITGGTITGLSTPSGSTDAATKGYVDTAVTGLLDFKGSTDCSANPNYPSASKGDTYVVTVAGKIGGASGKSVEVGDMYLATADNAGGTEASVGTSWAVLEHNLVGALLAANNLSDVANAATALTNLGGQAASGNLTATITTSTPTNLTGVLTGNGTDVDVVTPSTTNRVLTYSSGGTIIWNQVNNSMIQTGQVFTGNLAAGAVTNVKVASGIDAVKIGAGTVDNTEWGYLNGVTSSIQSQLDAKAASSSLGTMATQNASAVAITGGTITGLSTPSGSTDAATKGYVDTAVTGLLEFKGSTDCSANPNYPAGSKGDTYVVTVAGKIGGASGKSVEVGDMYLCTVDAASGNEATVGTSWSVLEHNLVGALLAANNLSDLASASTARTNLGLAIGTNVQAYNADLGGIATLNTNGIPVRTSAGNYAARTITGTTNVITVTNGDGVGGNPTLTVGSLVMRTDTAAVLTAQQNFGSQALTDGTSISWDLSTQQSAKVTLGGNRTLSNPTNMVDGGTYTLRVKQDGTGSRTLSYGSAYDWGADGAPTLTTTANKLDVLTFVSDGTKMYGAYKKGFG